MRIQVSINSTSYSGFRGTCDWRSSFRISWIRVYGWTDWFGLYEVGGLIYKSLVSWFLNRKVEFLKIKEIKFRLSIHIQKFPIPGKLVPVPCIVGSFDPDKHKSIILPSRWCSEEVGTQNQEVWGTFPLVRICNEMVKLRETVFQFHILHVTWWIWMCGTGRKVPSSVGKPQININQWKE